MGFDIVNIAIAAAAACIGVPCAYHALLHIWAFHWPNGKTAEALRPTTIVLETTVAPGPLKPTAWQRRTHQTEQLIAKRLGILVRQGQRRAAVDERIARHLETLVTEQRTRPPRNFRGVLGADLKCPWPRGRNLPERSAGKVELPPVRGAGYEPSASSGEPTGVAPMRREKGEEGRGKRDWERETGGERLGKRDGGRETGKEKRGKRNGRETWR
ncbi:hypothetical protein V495_00387 [Pseudogymnoascus sp. VKM F-4514 (FW-929)]|nr:hypothetical protein V495_00387 [Pseudogymnoascus sp. VKM F-4514 (FW-929)]KFY66602.1 hypothetical protein V497_00829 [Pseudogymnoascus sp. VKM F-4516 (FW-969)]